MQARLETADPKSLQAQLLLLLEDVGGLLSEQDAACCQVSAAAEVPGPLPMQPGSDTAHRRSLQCHPCLQQHPGDAAGLGRASPLMQSVQPERQGKALAAGSLLAAAAAAAAAAGSRQAEQQLQAPAAAAESELGTRNADWQVPRPKLQASACMPCEEAALAKAAAAAAGSAAVPRLADAAAGGLHQAGLQTGHAVAVQLTTAAGQCTAEGSGGRAAAEPEPAATSPPEAAFTPWCKKRSRPASRVPSAASLSKVPSPPSIVRTSTASKGRQEAAGPSCRRTAVPNSLASLLLAGGFMTTSDLDSLPATEDVFPEFQPDKPSWEQRQPVLPGDKLKQGHLQQAGPGTHEQAVGAALPQDAALPGDERKQGRLQQAGPGTHKQAVGAALPQDAASRAREQPEPAAVLVLSPRPVNRLRKRASSGPGSGKENAAGGPNTARRSSMCKEQGVLGAAAEERLQYQAPWAAAPGSVSAAVLPAPEASCRAPVAERPDECPPGSSRPSAAGSLGAQPPPSVVQGMAPGLPRPGQAASERQGQEDQQGSWQPSGAGAGDDVLVAAGAAAAISGTGGPPEGLHAHLPASTVPERAHRTDAAAVQNIGSPGPQPIIVDEASEGVQLLLALKAGLRQGSAQPSHGSAAGRGGGSGSPAAVAADSDTPIADAAPAAEAAGNCTSRAAAGGSGSPAAETDTDDDDDFKPALHRQGMLQGRVRSKQQQPAAVFQVPAAFSRASQSEHQKDYCSAYLLLPSCSHVSTPLMALLVQAPTGLLCGTSVQHRHGPICAPAVACRLI